MKATYKLFLLLIALGTSGRSAFAQESAPTVTERFRVLSWHSVITDLNYAQDKKIIPIKLLPNGRSSFYDYQGTDPLLFFREIIGPDGKPAAEVAASVPLANFKERTLLLFFQSPTKPKEYTVQVIDDSDAAIPPGSYHFFNLTGSAIQVKCGSAGGVVAPHDEGTVPGAPAVGGQIMGLQVEAVTAAGTRPVYSNQLPFGKTSRTLVFVSQVPETGAYQVKRLAEDVAALPKPSPSPR